VGAGTTLTGGLVWVSHGAGLGAAATAHRAAAWCLPTIWVLPVALLLGRLLVR
jgi:hypothetical protein